MKITYSILALLFIAVLVTWTQLPEISNNDRLVTRLPWLIQTDETGGSRVFGLAIGGSTARQAQETFNDEAEFAVFIDSDERRSLEAFFNYTRIAGLQARITLTLKSTAAEIEAISRQAIDRKAQPSNSYKLVLPDELKETLLSHQFTSLTYQPKIKIEQQILQARFGKPGKILQTDEKTQQWLYPEKGLSILTSPDEKPVFIYVRPDRFDFYHNLSSNDDTGQHKPTDDLK
jgi:hypothetical protein